MAPITKDFYGNYICLDPEGKELFRCAKRKMEWYLKRKLAEKIDDKTFKLLFTPKGPGHSGDAFFLQDRQNKCVVCGTTKDLTKHHVVPHCYRRFFPRQYDRIGPYDVMMLCESDHHQYEEVSFKFKQQLAIEYDAPVHGVVARNDSVTYGPAIKLAYALLEHGSKIPSARKELLLGKIRQILNKEEIIETDLRELCDRELSSQVTTHGQIVVSKITDFDQFNIRWRTHFLEVMSPKYLPEHWSVGRKFYK